jgi:hypothetical protein
MLDVGRNESRVGARIGNDHDFARPGQHIDVAISVDGLFGQRDK